MLLNTLGHTTMQLILKTLRSLISEQFNLGDFNIDLLKAETCNFSHNFLLSLQSYHFLPTIDKPTRVHNNIQKQPTNEENKE